MPMTSLAPRPGPAAIQRANSLQASDTSHTSASTTDASTSNTSASTSPIKPSPVSSIGESIGSSHVAPIPVCTVPRRLSRPLPIPPTVSPALTSTSTLKLSHQESQSTLGKSSHKLSASQSQTASRRDRNRPPPSSFIPHQTDDDRWVSISVLPALSERTDATSSGQRQAEPGPRLTNHKRSASAGPKLAHSVPVASSDSKATFPKHTTRIIPTPKALPQLPLDTQAAPTRQTETSWKLEFRGVVKLVRWVSRRDKRTDSGVENERVEVLDEKDPGVERTGYSVASLSRKSRSRPRPAASTASAALRPRPSSLARPHPKLEMEGAKEEEGKEPNKRRLTKSNPIMFGRGSSELKKQPSIELKKKGSKTELGKRSGRRSSSDAARKVLSGAALNVGRPSTAEGGARPSVDMSLGMALNGGGVFVPESSLSVPSNSAFDVFPPVGPAAGPSLPGSGSAPVPPMSYSPPYLRNPAPAGVAPALLTQTTITQTITTTTTLASPSGFTSTPFVFNAHPFASTTATVLTPVLEGQLFGSPAPIQASEFPWTTAAVGPELAVGVAVSGGLSPVESHAISSIASFGGVSPIVSSVDASASNMSSITSTAASPLMSNTSPLLSNGASPLMSSATSPLMSNSSSPMMHNVPSLPMSSTASPVLPANVRLSETPNRIPSMGTPAAGSTLGYTTAHLNGNSVSAQVRVDPAALMRYGAATDLGHDPRYLSASDAHFGAATDLPRFSAAATDLGHGGTSTRATSPTPSERYAFSDDVHEYQPSGGLLRALSNTEHSDAPLPLPLRPFMAARNSNGSGVTFDDSSAQSSPRIGERRKMMTMSSSDVGHGQRIGPARHQVQRSSSSLSVAGRIVRAFSIGSNKGGQESETEAPKVRKLIRKKVHSRTGSMVSLVIPGSGVPPVPPLPPGFVSGRYASEHGHGDGSALGHGESVLGHGESVLGHGDSVLGHSQYATACGGSSSVLGHGDPSTISPAPTRNSFATTQSAPTTVSGGRKLKKRQPGQSRHAEVFGRTLASLELTNSASSRDPPRITTEFLQVPLIADGEPLTSSVCGTTEDGHLMMPVRPGLPRRTSSQRRWTIADMDDEEFLRQLEDKLSGAGGRLRKSRMLEDFAMGVDGNDLGPEDDRDSDSDDSVAEREWIRARRGLMCVREIVRTEKSHMRHLIAFISSEDFVGMSPILVEHLPRLIETSRLFCARLEEDPSAKGVSEAFLEFEEMLDSTFVQWSSVVGEVISSTQQRTESQATSDDGHTSGSTGNGTSRRRSATGGSGRMPSFPLSLSMTPVNGGNNKNKKSARGTKPKKMTEQDVVIMPIQRAIRYELMYRALLLHTPLTSASRPLVERALQGATRIARRCDEAQNHADHILSPSS
ncbi:unnamed protein product [Rhizoctonia solani]|uniref:DH domain-containing protein n=1 Tax=Rhizoctonia solani TaxID=456999 RepID=A0A8H2X2Q1_9AGAM|nr:unnamed protein product [Rhizoctonia solani]